MNYQEQYQEWLTNPYFDEETKQELKAIADNENEIKERFYKDLEFGTAGLRGVIGAGTNRLNIYNSEKSKHRDLRIIFCKKDFRKKVWQSHMTQEGCRRSLRMRRLCV